MTTFIEELNNLRAQIHFKEDSIPGIRAGQLTEETKQAILNLVSERIIGDDDYPAPGYRVLTLSKKHRNEHRDEQRTTLYEGTKNGDNK